MNAMVENNDNAQAARCNALRHKLRSLQYFQPLGEESCALVEKLLEDVLKSVENFEILAKRYDQNAKKLQEWQDSIESLKAENVKLIEDNTNLHSAIRVSEKKFCNLKSEYSSTVKHYEDVEHNSCPSATIPPTTSKDNTTKTLSLSQEFNDESGRRLSVLSLELESVQQENEKLIDELKSCQKRLNHVTSIKDTEISEMKQKIKIMKSDILLISTERDKLLEQNMHLKKDADNSIEKKKGECISGVKQESITCSSPENAMLNGPSSIKNDESQLHLDQERKIALLEQKISQLERNLRLERSRTNKHQTAKSELAGELEKKIQEVERLQTLQAIQRRKTRHLSSSVSPRPTAKQVTSSNKVNDGKNATQQQVSLSASPLFHSVEPIQNSPNIQPAQENNHLIDLPKSPFFQETWPNLLSHYFNSVSPIGREEPVSPMSPPQRLSASLPIISKTIQPTNLMEYPQASNCMTSNYSDNNAENDSATLRAECRKLRQQMLLADDTLQSIMDIKNELQKNLELKDQSFKTQQTIYNRKIASLQAELKSAQLALDETNKDKGDLERNGEVKDETIMILEGRIDLLARRISELTSAAEESVLAGSTDLKFAAEMAEKRETEIRSLRCLNSTLNSRLTSAESACRRLAETTNELKELLSQSNKEVEKLRSESIKTQIYLDEKETEYMQLREEFISIKNENKDRLESECHFENYVKQLEDNLKMRTSEVGDLQEKLKSTEEKKIDAEMKFEDLKKEVIDVSKAMQSSTKAVEEQQNDLNRLREENQNLIILEKKLQQKLSGLTTELQSSQLQNEMLKSKIEHLENRLIRYRKTFKAQQELGDTLKRQLENNATWGSELSLIAKQRMLGTMEDGFTPRSDYSMLSTERQQRILKSSLNDEMNDSIDAVKKNETKQSIDERAYSLSSHLKSPITPIPENGNSTIERQIEKGGMEGYGVVQEFSNSYQEFEKKRLSKLGDSETEFSTPMPIQPNSE